MLLMYNQAFCAGHRIENHPGKCRNLHGHTYNLLVLLDGPVNPETGMVLDFGTVKGILAEFLEPIDHHTILCRTDELARVIPAEHLYFIPCQPTAENLSILFYDQLWDRFSRLGVKLASCAVSESSHTRAQYGGEGP